VRHSEFDLGWWGIVVPREKRSMVNLERYVGSRSGGG